MTTRCPSGDSPAEHKWTPEGKPISTDTGVCPEAVRWAPPHQPSEMARVAVERQDRPYHDERRMKAGLSISVGDPEKRPSTSEAAPRPRMLRRTGAVDDIRLVINPNTKPRRNTTDSVPPPRSAAAEVVRPMPWASSSSDPKGLGLPAKAHRSSSSPADGHCQFSTPSARPVAPARAAERAPVSTDDLLARASHHLGALALPDTADLLFGVEPVVMITPGTSAESLATPSVGALEVISEDGSGEEPTARTITPKTPKSPLVTRLTMKMLASANNQAGMSSGQDFSVGTPHGTLSVSSPTSGSAAPPRSLNGGFLASPFLSVLKMISQESSELQSLASPTWTETSDFSNSPVTEVRTIVGNIHIPKGILGGPTSIFYEPLASTTYTTDGHRSRPVPSHPKTFKTSLGDLQKRRAMSVEPDMADLESPDSILRPTRILSMDPHVGRSEPITTPRMISPFRARKSKSVSMETGLMSPPPKYASQ